jgi:hypothetical protein
MVHVAGAKLVLVDCDPDTLTINVDATREAITSHTKGCETDPERRSKGNVPERGPRGAMENRRAAQISFSVRNEVERYDPEGRQNPEGERKLRERPESQGRNRETGVEC